ncbi:MAG: ATP-dependent DNA helicase [Acidimicrobiales bacterium]|jgi:ATP-dependent DNA helicase DinG|nr:ATP-dependent DNA helicase [Acidimicrobiales bacterium]MDP6649665.1 ATP-dependent DNA helicase [Acidimicrobiales bacterium]MDP6759865.1 ATP-dependent DNA helicase [Acidimicrobiales bacterium]|tara:strand:+ start:3811 stop:5724 length:1914 start_codon:yes stop_codon:yes gene_type:complete
MDPEQVAIALEEVTAHLPNGGERRPGQEAMARAVAEVIDGLGGKNHLAVQAGTGTGKTLAYLIPALLAKRRTIIATATKALQDQLANNDLPFLAEHLSEHLDEPVSFAILKGRSNYVCLQRLAEVAEANIQQTLDGLAEQADDEQLAAIADWATETDTGDRAELSFEPNGSTWSAVTVGSHECPGRNRCPAGDGCFAELARDRAAEAQVIVTNLHLYGIDVATDGAILPPHDLAILDEAHAAEDILAAAVGAEVFGGRFRSLRRIASGVLSRSTELDNLADLADRFDDSLVEHLGKRLTPAEDPVVGPLLELADTRLEALQSALRAVPADAATEARARAQRALLATGSLLGAIRSFRAPDDGFVAWVEGPRNRPVLCMSPVVIAGILEEKLFNKERPIVLTSATLPPNLVGRLGLPEGEHRIEDVGSPFDFERQTLLYCAAHLPDPREPGYRDAVHDELERLILAAGGRTLALFTSWSALDAAHAHLVDRLPYAVLHQNDLPKPALIEAFAADEASCLFGTRGLWQGIDVPGPALSLVTIDRIPFPRPDDPLLSARREQVGEGSFAEIDIPIAATDLAQASGRLIRTATDIGVIAVLDRRLAKSHSYRRQLLAALPPMPRTDDPDEVERFLRNLFEG